MEKYKLDNQDNPDKIFIINRSELEGRIEAEYYKPSIRLLEYKIREKALRKLKDFALKMASGATPSVREEDKYYSNKENGVPFLRVQNLQTNGKLQLDDVKHINKNTHETMLKRSQVAEHDLLVKITGVGRMAIASVAPEGFVGNTNQHMVVIKTGDKNVSNYLAKYLNLDIVERLASRRSTGATRPALDYPALKFIPIIEGMNFSELDKAESNRMKKHEQAQKYLDEIEYYLDDVFGIRKEQFTNTLENRIFTVKFNDVTSDRLDAQYNSLEYQLLVKSLSSTKYELRTLGSLSLGVCNGKEFRTYSDKGLRYLRVSDMGKLYINNKNPRYIEIPAVPKSIKLTKDDLLISRSGSLGLVSIVTDEVLDAVLSSHIFKVRLDCSKVIPEFVETFLRYRLGQFQFFKKNNGGVIPEINQSALKSILVICPPIKEQEDIVSHVQNLIHLANICLDEGDRIVRNAKAGIENKIA